MTETAERVRVGEIRPSAIMWAFGVGAVIDLPHFSVIMMGLDDWNEQYTARIEEPRLLQLVRGELGSQAEGLRTAPSLPSAPSGRRSLGPESRVGVPVATFPRWMVCPFCRLLAPLSAGLFTFSADPYRPDRSRYVHANCSKARSPAVVPARFMTTCEHGHLDDFPWGYFVHRGAPACPAALRLFEFGVSGESTGITVRCDGCGSQRPLSDAFRDERASADETASMPLCRGRRPHLRDFEEDGCDRKAKTILLGASDLWFPETRAVLAIPAAKQDLPELIAEHWSLLEKAGTLEILRAFRQIGQLRDFAEYSDEAIWEAMEVHRSAPDGESKDVQKEDILRPEWEAFTHLDPKLESPDFRLRPVSAPAGTARLIQRVVLVERLRAVNALIGFTRMESPDYTLLRPADDVERRVPLSRLPPTWVPASEVRGEGMFLQFSEAAINRWRMQPAVLRRTRQFLDAHNAWWKRFGFHDVEDAFPGMRYILLHSLSHALIRRLALECGYNSAGISERIYASDAREGQEPMAGILLYTSAPDSEGTLGGLVRLGETAELERHLRAALDAVTLCASDPLCAEHDPTDDAAVLHGAACHACLFLPETACERGNRYLDRAVLVPPVLGPDGVAFFPPAAAQG